MALSEPRKAPFPYFGGKQNAAEHVWSALGDCVHYVEPFFGSGAVLLRRPHPCNRGYHSETVNDIDGHLCNFWRSVQRYPDRVAEFASWPVSEMDLMARHLWLVKWGREHHDQLRGDVVFCDPEAAGYWAWGLCSWIGGGWCTGTGPWTYTADGRLVKQTHSGGVEARRPHLSDNGNGVNSQTLREPGVGEFHPMTMPELRRLFDFLCARLRHVRIINGDWTRAVTTGASKILPVRMGDGVCGIFLDPPYGDVRAKGLYAHDSMTVAQEVQTWCIEHGDDPQYRIVLAGFEVEHSTLCDKGWKEIEWFKNGLLAGGMGKINANGHQMKRERLWLSPHCLDGVTQMDLFKASPSVLEAELRYAIGAEVEVEK